MTGLGWRHWEVVSFGILEVLAYSRLRLQWLGLCELSGAGEELDVIVDFNVSQIGRIELFAA